MKWEFLNLWGREKRLLQKIYLNYNITRPTGGGTQAEFYTLKEFFEDFEELQEKELKEYNKRIEELTNEINLYL